MESDSITLLLKRTSVASQLKSVACSQELMLSVVPSASHPAPHPSLLSHNTLDSQFLKCTGAHVHPAPSALSQFLLLDTPTPSLLISEQASVPRERLPWPPSNYAHRPLYLSPGALKIVVSDRQL